MVSDIGSDTYILTWLLLMVLTFFSYPFHVSCSSSGLMKTLLLLKIAGLFTSNITTKEKTKQNHKRKRLGLYHFSLLCSENRLERSLPCFSLKHWRKQNKTKPHTSYNSSKNFTGVTQSLNGNFQCTYMQGKCCTFQQPFFNASIWDRW